jgi:pantothenate kinase
VTEKKEDIPLRYLDRRVVERYLKKGLLDEKEYARYLKSLEDLAENAGSVETEFTSVGELGPTR